MTAKPVKPSQQQLSKASSLVVEWKMFNLYALGLAYGVVLRD